MPKRIYAVVSDRDFYNFQEAARKENLRMGPALTALVHAYAMGEAGTLEKYAALFDQVRIEEELQAPPRLRNVEE